MGTKALTRGAFNRLTPTALLGSLLGANGDKYAGAVMGTEDIMKPKAHGTSATPVQKDLRWNCDVQTADRICNFNELFTAPKGRSFEQFVKESRVHGWPSFRDDEVNWDYVRVLPDGEAVSVDGTHLGHNLPDKNGNRYCINLVSVAGRPKKA